MPRPLLNRTKVQQSTSNLSAIHQSTHSSQNQNTQTGRIGELLRKKRSSAYMAAIKKLDAGGKQLSQSEVEDLLATINGEFPEVNLTGVLEGYVAKCYLGGTFDVHTLDYMLQIVTHFHTGEPLPAGMERARSLAKRGYAYIEVYTDCCRAISENGDVSVVQI